MRKIGMITVIMILATASVMSAMGLASAQSSLAPVLSAVQIMPDDWHRKSWVKLTWTAEPSAERSQYFLKARVSSRMNQATNSEWQTIPIQGDGEVHIPRDRAGYNVGHSFQILRVVGDTEYLSNEVSVVVLPRAKRHPSSLSANLVPDSDSVKLEWMPGWGDGRNNYDKQMVMRRESGTESWTKVGEVYRVKDCEYVDDGVQPGSYDYMIESVFRDGRSATSNEAEITIPGERAESQSPPARSVSGSASTPPSGLSATQTNGAVTLNWTPGSNANYVKQVIKRRESVAGTQLAAVADNLATDTFTHIDTTVESGKKYIYRVYGVNANGNGAMSNAAQIQLAAPPVQSGNRKPSGLSAAQSGGQVTLTWAPGNNPDYVKQVIVRREAKRGTSLASIADNLSTTATSYTDTTVESGKKYIYRVYGMKANDVSEMSNPTKISIE